MSLVHYVIHSFFPIFYLISFEPFSCQVEACANNENAKSAIQVCLKADLRVKN
jgi:hypothetical protein